MLALHYTKHSPLIQPPLPHGKNLDGKLAWEPPILNYLTLINEEHKKREAVLKHFSGDRAKATNFMDFDTGNDILGMYEYWLINNSIVAY